MAIPTSGAASPHVIFTVEHTAIFSFPGESISFFAAGMAIDADGAPTAYHPIPGKGLDDLANAGHEGNWYGVVTDNGRRDGKPVVQGPRDPAPGFYVSPTALQNSHLPATDPRRYVDATSVPYISLPGHTNGVLHMSLGDLAMVINGQNGRRSPAVYADVGPPNKIGEGSIALARALGLNDNARHGGTKAHSILYVVFPHSSQGFPASQTITAAANSLFQTWGGIPRLAKCFPAFANHLH